MRVPSAPAALLASLLLPCAAAGGTDLGPPGYLRTETDVASHADLALDLRDMSSLLRAEDYDGVAEIYSSGRNSDLVGSDGTILPQKRPLRWGNTNAKGVFHRDATYLFHVYGLARGNPDAAVDNDDVLLYADNFVDAEIGRGGKYVADAARALNLWMFAVHRMWDVLRTCAGSAASYSGGGESAAPQGGGGGDEEMALAKLDEAVAYWIGSGFDGGADFTGHALFGLAQEVSSSFGTDRAAGDSYFGEGVNLADANYRIWQLYDQAKVLLGSGDGAACGSFDGASVNSLYMIVNDVIGQMSVPLVQSLVAAMYEKDAARVRMYAMSIVPQLSACRPSAHAFLQDGLLDRDYDPARFAALLGELQSTYECLGISCGDVGTYMNGKVPQCADNPGTLPLAGFSPTSDVREQAKIDVDILQIKAATKLGAYGVARMIYARGRNSRRRGDDGTSVRYRTLRMMAKSRDRNLVDPFYDEYQMYFDDDDYADTAIDAAVNGVGKWGKGSASQRSEIIVETLQYQVMYMYALTQLHRSLEACLSEDPARMEMDMARHFDEAVAYMIGSLEGHADGGAYRTKDGMLLYGLANQRCLQFGQCKDGKPARILGVYKDLFYAAKGTMNAGNCKSLTTTIHKIEHVIMVPVIQSVIRYAIKNEKLPADSPSKDLAEGEVFALAVLPIVDLYEDDSADVLERNMIVERGRKPVADGDQRVADALYEIMDEFGIPCDFIGATEGVTPCVHDEGFMSRSGATNELGGRYSSVLLAAAATLLSAVVM